MKKLHYIWMAVIILTALLSCTYTDDEESDNEELAAEEPVTLTAFGFRASDNTVLENDYAAVIAGTEVTITIDEKVDLSALKPYFTLSGTGILSLNNENQISGVTANNFFSNSVYTVTGSEGTIITYTITVNYDTASYAVPELLISASDNSGLFISEDLVPALSENSFNFDLPIEADLSSVQLSCSVFESFSVSVNGTAPVDNEVTVDFSEPAAVTVTTPSGELFLFTITCTQTAAVAIDYFKNSINQYIITAITANTSLLPELPDGYIFSITNSVNITIDDAYMVTDYESGEVGELSYRVERCYDDAVLEDTVTCTLPDTEYPSETTKSILIYGIAPEGPAGVTDECVILYNNSSDTIDLGDYKIKYMTGTGATITTKYTFSDLFSLSAGHYILIAGASFLQSGWNGDTVPDITLDSEFNFSGKSGHVLLFDNEGTEVDRVGYGDASCAETSPVEYTGEGGLIFRTEPGNDTDDNLADFSFALPSVAILKNTQSL